MSSTAVELKHDLECLRMASDFMQLSRETLDPELRAHCLRMSAYWTERVESRPLDNLASADSSAERNDRVARPVPFVVLIVEDECLLRELAVELVADAGFVTLQAADAEEAIAVLEARSDIAAIFTDINFPGSLDGLELAFLVRDRWPAIKILVASGRIRPKPSELPPNSVFLQKPYRGDVVVAQLRSLVGPSQALIGSGLLS